MKIIYTNRIGEKTIVLCEHVGISDSKIVCYADSTEHVIIRTKDDKVEVLK